MNVLGLVCTEGADSTKEDSKQRKHELTQSKSSFLTSLKSPSGNVAFSCIVAVEIARFTVACFSLVALDGVSPA